MTITVKHSTEAKVRANGIDIVYDTFGDPEDPPLLLIMGLGRQMILWDEAFCSQLAAHKRWVIRFDNRDVGLSTHFSAFGIPSVIDILEAASKGDDPKVPYRLEDMAGDVLGLMAELGIESAHLVGASMGGILAQIVALQHPERVRTLTSMMSSSGDPSLPKPTGEALQLLSTPAPSERKAYAEHSLRAAKVLAGPGFPVDEERSRKMALRAFDRNFDPAGFARQYAAIIASGSRRDDLKRVSVPTLVIHGQDDPLVSVEAAKDIAAVVPGAKLEIVEGMGHHLPVGAWPRIIQLIIDHTNISEVS